MHNAAGQLVATTNMKFTVSQRRIANKHEFQFYVVYGAKPGPWMKVGVNEVEYFIGYLPQPQRRPSVGRSQDKQK